jgi:hypothetical protein
VIAYIVVALLVFVALAYIAGPLRAPEKPDGEEGRPDTDALERKRAALGGILDLEEEYAAGKLTTADFESLRLDYERDAVEALKELDVERRRDDLDDAIEREIAAVKARSFCPSCGGPRVPGEPCLRCGA